MSLVLDCSATLAWIFPDETTKPIQTLFEQVVEQGALVPNLWRIEVANSLTMAVRSGRFTEEERTSSLKDLADLEIAQDEETWSRVWNDTLSLADLYRLTVYDATYLELALRLSIPLATLDADLRKAARSARVTLLGK
ncbi:type II toxin-antitoxin system VapC family toxin [Occallatibacter savannae]|uniref:type II toxin-antitoxin system VapC family toxin n=1 Tax=Occallatibacter savannae TaxID=1002691 RepID=UPI000D6997E1|nr:type II toxin-antitoxin system VapC family toxin [Occallatibacter savannae]